MTVVRPVYIVGFALLVGRLALPGQSPTQQVPTFRGGIEIARTTVRVLDAHRKPVRDLTEKDFTILIDGKPRPIVAFTTEDAAGPAAPTAPWMRDVAPDVAGNTLAHPRLVVILLDDGLTPDLFTLRTAQEIARKAIDQLGPNDLASIVFTKDNRAPQDFTADRAKLLAAVDRMNMGFDPRSAPEWRYGEMRSISVLRLAVDYLSAVPHLRSLLLYVTVGPRAGGLAGPMKSGLRTEANDLSDSEAALQFANTYSAVLNGAQSAAIPVYAISTLGLVAPNQNAMPHSMPFSVQWANEISETLRNISDATGGHAISADNRPARLVPNVFIENGLYYTLGYDAEGTMADGRYRRFEVRVNRPGLIVEPGGDRMVFSPKPVIGPLVADTTRALSGLVALADEPLRLAAAAFADLRASTTGAVSGSVALALGMEVPGSAVGDDVELEVRVFDGEGRKQIDARKQTMHVRASPRDRSFDFLMTLPLKPGRYNLRVSAHSTARDKSGSVHTDITIPDYVRAPFSLSDVAVRAAPGRTAAPAGGADASLPVVPTSARAFGRTDHVSAFLRAYWGRDKPAGPVTITATITNAENRDVFRQSTTLNPEATSPVRTADYRLELPISDLAAGQFVLTLRATMQSGAETVRHVRFEVR